MRKREAREKKKKMWGRLRKGVADGGAKILGGVRVGGGGKRIKYWRMLHNPKRQTKHQKRKKKKKTTTWNRVKVPSWGFWGSAADLLAGADEQKMEADDA